MIPSPPYLVFKGGRGEPALREKSGRGFKPLIPFAVGVYDAPYQKDYILQRGTHEQNTSSVPIILAPLIHPLALFVKWQASI